MLKISKALLVILFLSLFVRFLFLDRIPVGVSNDELDYILNAKAVFLTGSDISGTWNPLSLTPPASSFPQAEIPPLLTFLPIGLLPLSLLFSKSIYVLFNCGIVVLLYFIAKRLFSQKIAFTIGLVASINPWLLFFGRTAYDTPLAIFLFLLAWYLLLLTKGWKILFSAVPLVAGFYSYIGTKLLLIPFVLATGFYSWIFVTNKKFLKQYLILFAITFGVIFFYAVSLMNPGVTRVNELATPNISEIKISTDMQRREAVQTPFSALIVNKYVLFGKYAFEKYINAFSPNFLFIHGDPKALFSVFNHGVFYFLDLVFLIIGAYGMFRKHRNAWTLLFVISLIAPLPSVISTVGVSYAIRSMLLCPMLIMFIGYGIFYSFDLIKSSRKQIFVVCISVLYFLSFVNFSFIYFLQNPINNSESFNLSGRVLARYLFLNKSSGVAVITGNPKTPLKQYLFYGNLYNSSTAKKVQKMYVTNHFQMNNISFLTCKEFMQGDKGVLVYESGIKCTLVPKAQKYETIAQLSDGGSIFTIVNDSVCSKYRLNKFPQHITFSDLNIEQLSEEQFCKTFITNYFQ